MDIVGVLKDPDLLGHKRVLVPAAIDDAADEITRLRAELAACLEAVGMLTTLAPSMEINVLDPVGMAHQIVATVNAELAVLAGEFHLAVDACATLRAELAELRARLEDTDSACADYAFAGAHTAREIIEKLHDRIRGYKYELAEARKPDCRTCAHVYTDMESYGCKRSTTGIVCIKGDGYAPSLPVRLYETGEA